MNKSMLLIGKPHASKTVFLSQLYSRLRKKEGKITLYEPVKDLTPISAAREALANGDEPQTTPPDESVKFNLPLLIDGEKLDLLCPEYGGEQVNQIIDSREVNKEWTDAIKSSDHWLLFIRLSSIGKSMDISDVTVTDISIVASNNEDGPEFIISEQSSFIELLQIFLHLKGHDYHQKNRNIRLTIALTCWDELKLDPQTNPSELLKLHMPLFNAFLKANWEKSALHVIGLSAQGFSLKDQENKTKYMIYGPESYGYLKFDNEEPVNDITILIEKALK